MNISSNPSPPLSPASGRSHPGLLPSYMQHHQQQQHPQEGVQLLRPLAVIQQQQHKQPRQCSVLLQQLAARRAAIAFYTLLALGLIWFVAAGRARPTAEAAGPSTILAANTSSGAAAGQDTLVSGAGQTDPARSQPSSSSSSLGDTGTPTQPSAADATPASSSSSSSSAQLRVRCPYGSLPGTWVSDAPTGAKWQLFDPACQLTNWLETYSAAAAAAADSSNTELLPSVNVLLLSDSVDRFVLQHVCDYLHGVKHTIHARQQHMHPASPESEAAAGAAAAAAVVAAGAASQQELSPGGSSSSIEASTPAAPAADGSSSGSPSPGPSNLNATAYAFHTCQLPEWVPLKLASSYFPGVHPTGPFHRGLTQNYAARIDAATAMWEEYAGAGQPPHVVGVASALWDVARLWMHERQQLEGPELSRPLLEGWVANFSTVVHYTQKQLPQTQLWLTHTTMLPAHDVTTGAMTKPYLGRRYFIEQLNAAAASASRQLGLQLLDYAAVSSRFREGQQHLEDLIHPNAEMALEVFNVLLNLAIEPRQL